MYLFAIMDLYSRYVITWQLSNTLDTLFCLEGLERALQQGKPDIFHSDRGVQFTSHQFTDRLQKSQVLISMTGKGRCMDNILVERLWRTLQYEDIYLKDYPTIPALHSGLGDYFYFYAYQRLHQSLDYRTPAEIYLGHNALFPVA